MKTSVTPIASAMSCYFGGMPLDAIQRHLQQQYDLYMSESGIYNWIVRFSKEAVKKAKEFKPDTGDTWVADETVIKVGGKNIWFWDVIDKDSRYLLASRLSTTRTTKDAALVMKEAQRAAGKTPKKIITDRLAAYIDGIELVFGADTKHVQSKPFIDKDSTNVIERFHGTMKDRTNVIRGFKNMANAELLTDAWLVHYNFFKEHETLGNIPPAQKMKIPTPFKDWNDVLHHVKQDMVKVSVKGKPTIMVGTIKERVRLPKTPRVRLTPPTPRITPKRRMPSADLYVGSGMLSRHPFRGSKGIKLKGIRRR